MLEKQIMLDSGGNYPPFCDRSFWLVQGFNRMSFFLSQKKMSHLSQLIVLLRIFSSPQLTLLVQLSLLDLADLRITLDATVS